MLSCSLLNITLSGRNYMLFNTHEKAAAQPPKVLDERNHYQQSSS